MMTPRALAEHFERIASKAVREGRGADLGGVSVLDARSICLGIKWICDGTYPWLSESEMDAVSRMAVSLRELGHADGTDPTPEQEAINALERFELMSVDDESGLTHRQVARLCQAMFQLVSASYPHPLTETALASRAGIAGACPTPFP